MNLSQAMKIWPIWLFMMGAYAGHVVSQHRISQLEKQIDRIESNVGQLVEWKAEMRGRFSSRARSR